VPGLVLATMWPATSWTFVEAHRRRAAFLEAAAITEMRTVRDLCRVYRDFLERG